jgi:hypothetical protein
MIRRHLEAQAQTLFADWPTPPADVCPRLGTVHDRPVPPPCAVMLPTPPALPAFGSPLPAPPPPPVLVPLSSVAGPRMTTTPPVAVAPMTMPAMPPHAYPHMHPMTEVVRVVEVVHHVGAVKLQTPLFDAQCDHVSCTGNPDELVLEGHVRLTMKRGHTPCHVNAHRVVVNTKSGTFRAESGGPTVNVTHPTVYEHPVPMPYAQPPVPSHYPRPVYRMPAPK